MTQAVCVVSLRLEQLCEVLPEPPAPQPAIPRMPEIRSDETASPPFRHGTVLQRNIHVRGHRQLDCTKGAAISLGRCAIAEVGQAFSQGLREYMEDTVLVYYEIATVYGCALFLGEWFHGTTSALSH